MNVRQEIETCPIDVQHISKIDQELPLSDCWSQLLPRSMQFRHMGPSQLAFDLYRHSITAIMLVNRHSHLFSLSLAQI